MKKIFYIILSALPICAFAQHDRYSDVGGQFVNGSFCSIQIKKLDPLGDPFSTSTYKAMRSKLARMDQGSPFIVLPENEYGNTEFYLEMDYPRDRAGIVLEIRRFDGVKFTVVFRRSGPLGVWSPNNQAMGLISLLPGCRKV